MYTSPRRTYARVGVRDPARMYTYVAVFSFLHPGRCTYVYVQRARLYYDTCAPLHPPVYMYVHVRDQNDNATYASTRWVPTVRHFLACEDVAGGSQQSGGRIVFFSDALPCVRRCSWWVPAVREETFFFAKYGGPSGGSPLSGVGIIILHIIRRHFLAAAVDPAVSVSTHSTLPMEVGR